MIIDSEETWVQAMLEIKKRGKENRSDHDLKNVLSSPHAVMSEISEDSYKPHEYDMIFLNPLILIYIEQDSEAVWDIIHNAWFVFIGALLSPLDQEKLSEALFIVSDRCTLKIPEEVLILYSKVAAKTSFFFTRLASDLSVESKKKNASKAISTMLLWQWFFELRRELGAEDSFRGSTTLALMASLLNEP